jgi:hypothetical protein
LKGRGEAEKLRKSLLDGSIYGQITVRDQLEPFPALIELARRAVQDDPGELELGQSQAFGEPAQPERKDILGCPGCEDFTGIGEIGEDLIRNESQGLLLTDPGD